jgi:hypothetical protein
MMVEELAEDAHRRSTEREADYRDLVGADEHRGACRQTLRLVLSGLAGLPVVDLEDAMRAVGRHRARQGVAMDAMLHTFRIDFEILGEALFAWLAERPPELRTEWSDFVLPLWQGIDSVSLVVAEGFREAEAQMAGERERDAQTLFHELLHGPRPLSTTVRAIASRFGLDARGRFVVVRADYEGDQSAGERVADAARAVGLRSLWLADATSLTGIVMLASSPSDPGRVMRPPVIGVATTGGGDPRDAIERLRLCLVENLSTRIGVSTEYGMLEETRDLLWLADAARDAARPGTQSVTVAAQDTLDVFVGAVPELSRQLASSLSDALAGGRPAERQRLLDTVRDHLAGDSSPKSTAERLYLHRNTVLNHLRRFTELTGFDLSRPEDAARAALALRALDRFGSTEEQFR